jgi:hypothetical protein
VSACSTEDYAVLLDIRRNKFLGLPHAQMRALASRLETGAPGSAELEELVARMVTDGMLTTQLPSVTRPAAPPATESLFAGFVPFRARCSLRDVHNAALSYIRARGALLTGTIEAELSASSRRARARHAVSGVTHDELREHIAAFAHCRAWLFVAAGACLLESLTVHEFLSRYGIASWLVVGVRTCPFSAHAWAQVGSIVINDRVEIVRAYTPISSYGQLPETVI